MGKHRNYTVTCPINKEGTIKINETTTIRISESLKQAKRRCSSSKNSQSLTPTIEIVNKNHEKAGILPILKESNLKSKGSGCLIVKERKIPWRIRMNEALLRRIVVDHPKRKQIEMDLGRSVSGFKGEKELDFYLESLHCHKSIKLLHDIRLPLRDYFFQIDCLILTPACLIIVEVKNIAGVAMFSSQFNQFSRILNDVEEGLPNPLSQAQRLQYKLKEWLQQKNIPPLPIDYFVVFSNPTTIIKTSSDRPHDFNKVIRIENLLVHLQKTLSLNKSRELGSKEMNKISRLLIKGNTDLRLCPQRLYGIREEEIVRGVQCPNCLTIPMERSYSEWRCGACFFHSKEAHFQALEDYYFLISPVITNQEARRFLQIPSRHSALRILSSLRLPAEGKTKSKTYDLSSLFS